MSIKNGNDKILARADAASTGGYWIQGEQDDDYISVMDRGATVYGGSGNV